MHKIMPQPGSDPLPKVTIIIPICFAFWLFAFTVAAGAANGAGKQVPDFSEKITTSKSPINVTADRMEANQDERTIIFESHVVVRQDDLTITSNRLKVVLLPEENKPGSVGQAQSPKLEPVRDPQQAGDPDETQRIDYIEFEGDVKVTQQDRVATANKAIYYQKDQKIILHGRPVVTKGQDRVTGDLITIFLKENRSIVEGKVNADLTPQKKE